MKPRLWTVSGLAVELGRSPRTIGKALSGVAPDGRSGTYAAWLMATAVNALLKHDHPEATTGAFNPAYERARKDSAIADGLAMKNAEMRRTLLPADEVELAIAAMRVRIRDRLGRVPNDVATPAARCATAAEAQAVLTSAIHGALLDLARTQVVGLPKTAGR